MQTFERIDLGRGFSQFLSRNLAFKPSLLAIHGVNKFYCFVTEISLNKCHLEENVNNPMGFRHDLYPKKRTKQLDLALFHGLTPLCPAPLSVLLERFA